MIPWRASSILLSMVLGVGVFELSSSNDVQAENQGGCAQPGVRVVYDDPAELEMVCGTLADIVDYFRDISFEIAPFVLVSFENRPTDRRSDQVPVHGFFDAPRSESSISLKSSSALESSMICARSASGDCSVALGRSISCVSSVALGNSAPRAVTFTNRPPVQPRQL